MSLDQRASAATRELLEQLPPDPERMLADLKRTRRHRNVVRSAAALVAFVVIGATAMVTGGDDSHDSPDPAKSVHNGVIVAPADMTAGVWRHFRTFGATLHLPQDAAAFPDASFTADGSELVYPGPNRQMKAIDVMTGSTRTLGTCLDELCRPALSPDGTRLAYAGEDHLKIQTLATGDARPLPTPGVRQPATPVWSPDGSMIAFTGDRGLYTADVRTGTVRQVHVLAERFVFLAPAWSPDGQTLAFLDQRLRQDDPNMERSFTVMTVAADGTRSQELHAAGHCLCLGIPGPSLTWSPDGELIAVAVTKSAGGPGIFTMKPDGTGWELLHPGVYGDVDWQPSAD